MHDSHDPQARRLAELTSPAVNGLQKDEIVVVLPIGAVEQHGFHLPCNTDGLLVDAILAAALARLPAEAPVWTLPTLAYGTSTEHLGYPGTVSLSTETLLAIMREIARSVVRSGLRKLVVVNGHGGQAQLLEVAARDIRVETSLLVFPLFPYRAGLPEGLAPPSDGPPDLHAGWLETSLMLAVAPALVQETAARRDGDRMTDAYRESNRLSLEGSFPTAWVTSDVSASGTIGDPRGATAEVGARILDHLGAELALVLGDICRFQFSGDI